jgi:hypothetical protein
MTRLVAGLLPRKPWFGPRSFHVRFVVKKLAVGRGFLAVLRASLLSSHRSFMLIFICMLLLTEGRTCEFWEPSKKQRCFGSRRALGRKVFFTFCFRLRRLDFQNLHFDHTRRLCVSCNFRTRHIISINRTDRSIYWRRVVLSVRWVLRFCLFG